MPYAERTIAVLALLADQDLAGVIDALADRIDRWHVATVVSERAAGAERIAALLAARGLADRTRVFASVPLAHAVALREAGPNDRIVVFGSFLTVAAVLERPR